MDPFKLRRQNEELSKRLETRRQELATIERLCQHDWGDPKYTPSHQPGYHFAGDPSGTMGVDRQLPMDVPATTVAKWTRTCKKCGKIETTTKKRVARVETEPEF